MSREGLLLYHVKLMVTLPICGTTMMNQWKERRHQSYTSLKLPMKHLVPTSVVWLVVEMIRNSPRQSKLNQVFLKVSGDAIHTHTCCLLIILQALGKLEWPEFKMIKFKVKKTLILYYTCALLGLLALYRHILLVLH